MKPPAFGITLTSSFDKSSGTGRWARRSLCSPKITSMMPCVACFLCGIAAGLLVRVFYKGKEFFNFTGFSEPKNRDTDPNL